MAQGNFNSFAFYSSFTQKTQGFAGQLSDVVSKYRDATRDLDSEKVARRFSQQEAEEWRAKFERLQRFMVRADRLYILVVPDLV